MEKEIEAVKLARIEFEKNLKDDSNNEWLKRRIAGLKMAEQALIELKAIKEANPSEALESIIQAFEHTLEVSNKARLIFNEKPLSVDWNELAEIKIIKQVLLNAQEQKKENAELKETLRLIKEKKVNVDLFWNDFVDNKFGYHYYLEKWYKYQSTDKPKLTEEEFDLLKRWLEK